MLSSELVGEVLADMRKKKGVSQEVLSGLAGIARTHLSMIENGKRKPTLETFYKICTSLGVSPSEAMREIETRVRLSDNENL